MEPLPAPPVDPPDQHVAAPLSPHVLDAQEAGLRTLVDTGLPTDQVVEILGLVDAFVRGLARAAVAESVENDASGMSSDEYWTSMSSFWADWFDVERYPVMTRIWEAGGFDTPRPLRRVARPAARRRRDDDRPGARAG
ncbi:TetR/AcrR family transcriptional regulator C-terminal domain-containing protein [Oerskovia sp. M15]